MNLRQRALTVGLKEVVLCSDASWYPVDCVLGVAVVWPIDDACDKLVLLHGMEHVYVMSHQQMPDGSLSSMEGQSHNFSTFPETDPQLGKDKNGEDLLYESFTSKQWLLRTMLRTRITGLLGKTKPGCCNSEIIPGVDQQTWAMIETGFSGGGIRHFSAPRSQNCYLSDTYRPALHRVASKSTFSAIKVDRAPGFKHVSLFLGNYWNVFCSQTLQRQAASMSEQSHPYAPLECVRAIVEMVSAVGDADEEHLQALALELGLEPVKAKSCRRPKLPSLCLKYDADARILSLATHWVDLPFEQLQSLVKSSAVGSRRTPPASPSGNKHQPKKAKPSSVDVLYSPTKTVAEFWAPVMPPPDLPRAARRAKLAKAKVAS